MAIAVLVLDVLYNTSGPTALLVILYFLAGQIELHCGPNLAHGPESQTMPLQFRPAPCMTTKTGNSIQINDALVRLTDLELHFDKGTDSHVKLPVDEVNKVCWTPDTDDNKN